MLKVLTGALAIGLVGGAYAQATGPAAQTDNDLNFGGYGIVPTPLKRRS